jgi:hypothetical protein
VIAIRANQTVFSVLGEAARRRGTAGLAIQLVVSVALATAILLVAPHWWSLAFLAGWSAAYSAWGLIVRVVEARQAHPRSLNALLVTIAALGTALAVAGVIGIGLAMYSGNARGAKGGACGKNATTKYCQAFTNPAPATKLPIR